MRSPDDRRAALRRGAEAEAQVANLLGRRGWTVLDRNWRGGGGELDLVVARDGAVRFVEVKQRDVSDFSGAEAVGSAKRRRLIRAAEAWMDRAKTRPEEVAFMVALVRGDDVELIDDAFDG